ncbi:MAG: (Fe-S)-binding protein [Deltaproteobacteria bacterium]|nr:MAG: (Fe-S)-binding protein [Deltaproteobacteria bacterium]
MNITQLRRLSYDEVVKCNRCGFCLPNCPIYKVQGVESASPRGRNAITRAVIEGRLPWGPEIERSVFSCLGCGACTAACFPSLKTKEVVFQDRECLVSEGLYPKIADTLARYVEENYNISNEDNGERDEWRELLKNVPEHVFEKEHAEVIYFVGCVASFFPLVQKIPVNMAGIMERAEVDFTILGGEEWCCGYPLIGAGMREKIKALMDHNLEKVRELGAKKIVFTCPSCYRTWKTFYQPEIDMLTSSELLEYLLSQRKIPVKKINATVTYHDPCDLGRNSGIFDAPRAVLKSIPGIRLVELPNNRQLTMCCGGGGNLEMVDADLSGQVAKMKIEEILKTGADMVVTSCQQCVRTISTRARRQKIDLVVKDLTELVAEAMQ